MPGSGGDDGEFLGSPLSYGVELPLFWRHFGAECGHGVPDEEQHARNSDQRVRRASHPAIARTPWPMARSSGVNVARCG